MEKIKFDYLLLERDINTIAPIDCVGTLFKNKDGVLNIPSNLEDLQKSHKWFENKPQHLFLLVDYNIEINDWFISNNVNEKLNQKILKYLGPFQNDFESGIIEITDGKEIFKTTKSIFEDCKLIAATTDKSLDIAKISYDWIKDWFVLKGGKIDPKTRIMFLNKEVAISKNDEVVFVMEDSTERIIKAVWGICPIFETVKGISAGKETLFGIARDRNPDSGWSEFSQYNLEFSDKIKEVILDNNMKKILLEDICAYYDKNSYQKLKEFDLLNF